MISEPMTLATDYLLGGVTAWLSFRLFRSRHESRRYWGLAFASLAAAAFLGGTWHGFLQRDWLWKATVICAGFACFAMVAGSAFAVLRGTARRLVIGFALINLTVFILWMLLYDQFIWVVIDTGVALCIVAALHLLRGDGWMLAGVAVSVAAAVVQASGFALHPHFNHNDLYHVVQLGAMALFYRGARDLTDAGASG
jgi:hypothetical protein